MTEETVLQAMELTSMASLLAASEALRERHSNGLRELYQRSAQSTQRTPAQHEKIQEINLPPLVYFDDTGITSHGSTSEDPVKASLQEMLLNLQLQQQKTDWAIQSFLDASSMVRREEEMKARQTRTDDEVHSLSSQVASLKADKAAMQEEWAKAQEAWVKESKKNEQQIEKFLAEMASLKNLLALTRTEVVELKQSKTDTDEKVRCLTAEVNALQTSRKQLELRADIIETRYIVDMVKQKRAATGAILSSVERGEASVSSKGTENAASGSPKLIWTGCPLDLSTTTSSFILPYCQASDYVGILKTVNRSQYSTGKLTEFDGRLPHAWLTLLSFSLSVSGTPRCDWPTRMSSALTGIAAQWYRNMQREYPRNTITWPIFKHEFLTHYAYLQVPYDAKTLAYFKPLSSSPRAAAILVRRSKSRSVTPRK